VLGRGSIRLRDDLADGEVSAEETRSAVALSESLYALAVDQFRRHLPATSPFWGYLETCMRAWRESTGHMDADRLAARGAPLRISAYAVCLLTSQEAVFPIVEASIEHALTGLALYDDVGDWRSDLVAGRWNAFVAELGDHPQR